MTKVAFGKRGKPLQNMLKVWIYQKENSWGTGALWRMKRKPFSSYQGMHLVFVFSSGCLVFYIAVRPFLAIEKSSTLFYSSGDLHKANDVLLLIWLLTVFSGWHSLDQLSKIFFLIREGRRTLFSRKAIVLPQSCAARNKSVKVVTWMSLIRMH